MLIPIYEDTDDPRFHKAEQQKLSTTSLEAVLHSKYKSAKARNMKYALHTFQENYSIGKNYDRFTQCRDDALTHHFHKQITSPESSYLLNSQYRPIIIKMHREDNYQKTIQLLHEELDHFISLSRSQAEQIKRYEKLQKKSHQLIEKLTNDIDKANASKLHSFKKK